MEMPIINLNKLVINVILQAQNADERALKGLREKILGMVSIRGAKFFVDTTAEVLKNNFQIEGCNDVRIPLKRIFNISLDELEERLSRHKYNLPDDHPISLLSANHKESLERLKKLRLDLGQVKDYYRELDSHIRKEEEALFPVLEKNGMREHPENLREEHKKFRDALARIIKFLEEAALKGPGSAIDEVGKLKEEFISNISNHIFRETYIFYPAALEFITEETQWEKVKAGFSLIDLNEEAKEMDEGIKTLDLRPMPPFERHEKIFQTWDTLKAGDTLKIINDHDPRPLRYQFEVEYKDKYEWEYERSGPKDWIVRVKKI